MCLPTGKYMPYLKDTLDINKYEFVFKAESLNSNQS